MPEQDLWNTYFSSSKEVAKLREDTGNESFEYKIIFSNVDTDKCFNYEQTLIKEHINNPLCINKRYFDKKFNELIRESFNQYFSCWVFQKSS